MNKYKAGYVEGTLSVIVNVALFGLKFWAGIVSGSLALTADAWHTLSDSLSSLVVIAGVRLSSRKPDKEHPFGHGRWEPIAAIFIGFMLGIIAWDFMQDGIAHLKEQEAAAFGTLAIVVTVISIVVKEGLARYAFYLGRKTGNLSVKADGWHHRTDALSSVLVLAGIMVSGRFWWIDSLLGMLIALVLFYAAYGIIKEAIMKLLGEKPDEALIRKIEAIIASLTEQEVFPHHYHIHNYISNQELIFHIKVNELSTVVEAHALATRIEEKIFDELNIRATIHIEPKGVGHQHD